MPFYRIAVTGNAAAGKSTVVDLFRSWGAPIVDADQLAKGAVAAASPGLAAVTARFGPGILHPDGSLDRVALRRRILADPAEREALNAIIHPIVARLGAEAEGRLQDAGERYVVHDIPLLFESLDPALYDAVVLVDAPLAIRRARLLDRGLTDEEAQGLIAAQLPPEGKRRRSHFIIDNASSRDALEARAREVWRELQGRAGIA